MVMPEAVEQPEPRIVRAGRWTYWVSIVDGMTTYGPDGGAWLVFGRRQAHRKAARELRRYLRDKATRTGVVDNHVDREKIEL